MMAHHYVAPFLLLAVHIQPGAAEAAYTGRDETLRISLPTSLASSNANASEVQIIDTRVHVPLPVWIEQPLMPSWLATAIGLLGTTFFVLILLMVCFFGFVVDDAFKKNWHLLYRAPLALSPCTALELGVDRMRMEAVMGLQMQYVFFGIACLYGWLRGVHRLPGTLALLAVPWIGRNLYLNCLWAWRSEEDYAPVVPTSSEGGCCARTLAKLRTAVAILFGKLENLDAVSDGLAVASAYFVTAEVQARFAASFTSSTGALGWLCRHLGIGNMMLAALMYGTAEQGSLALLEQDDHLQFRLLAGLGGFAEVPHFSAETEAKHEQAIALLVALGRVCSESMVQALLQTSLVMAQGQSLVQQPVLAFSIALSCATLAGKAAGMIKNACLAWESNGLISFLSLCAALATLAVLAVVLLKLYASQSCESRLWGLTTGCVALT